MPTAQYFRDRGAECRGLAEHVANFPSRETMLDLALEFDIRAATFDTEVQRLGDEFDASKAARLFVRLHGNHAGEVACKRGDMCIARGFADGKRT